MKTKIKSLVKRINIYLWKLQIRLNSIRYPKLKSSSSITILSQNCIGGIVMKSYGMYFNTPTVNLYMTMPDFVKFCENIKYYQNIKPIYDKERSLLHNYIVCKLGDLIIHGVHYHNYEDFCVSWKKRFERINYEKIFIIMTDRDSFSDELIPRIEKLPYSKLLFAHKDYPNYDFIVKINGYENSNEVGSLTDFKGLTGKRIYDSYFDFGKALSSLLDSY